ncbi:MAG: hypothetical protein GKS04_01215 [Candidatus Mycalebacterium zealandia]|nr:MAG: hypothetical protein GKS04_01215 [Candidatus Mycalebacterium zealandia]
MKSVSVLCILALLTVSCGMTAADHSRSLASSQEQEMTVGIVQRDIQKGMSQADVAQSLGSPNIVTRDSEGLETWVYDKIASEASYSQSSGGVGLVLSLLWGSAKSTGASSSTQKTLTVIIKFDDKKNVSSFTYHSSKF